MGDSLCDNSNMAIGIFNWLVFAGTFWRLFKLKDLRTISADKWQLSFLSVIVNKFSPSLPVLVSRTIPESGPPISAQLFKKDVCFLDIS